MAVTFMVTIRGTPLQRSAHRRGLIGLVRCVVLLAAAGGCGPQQHVARRGVELREIAVPATLYSISGEARAFVADGEAGLHDRVRLSVVDLQRQLGAFSSARAFALDAKGNLEHGADVAVTDGKIELDVVASTRYVLYPDVSAHSRATYHLLCKLSKLHLPPATVSRLCDQIFCAGPSLAAHDLVDRVPGLEDHISPAALGGDLIGGFGPGAGTLCDRCIPQGVLYPDLDCREPGPLGPPPRCGEGDRLVFAHREANGATRTRIRVMTGAGANQAALTGGEANDQDPDVSLHGGHVAFVRDGAPSRLFRVETDGSGLAAIPGTEGGMQPCWGRGPEDFLAFTRPVGATPQTAIFRIGPFGGTPVQVTFPGAGQDDSQPAVLDAKHLLFTRTGAFGRQLFIQNLGNGEPATQLTSLENRGAVNAPVAGHVRDDRLVAFVADFSVSRDSDIRVGRLDETFSSLEILHTIRPGEPVDHRIGRIDFSSNDACLFFDAITTGVGGLPDAEVEIYSIDFDGSHLERLTTNQLMDAGPAVITH